MPWHICVFQFCKQQLDGTFTQHNATYVTVMENYEEQSCSTVFALLKKQLKCFAPANPQIEEAYFR